MVLMKEPVLYLKEKHDTTLFLIYFQIDCKYLTSTMTDSLNIIFDDFGIYLPGYIENYRVKLSIYSTRALLHKFLWL